MVFYELYIYLNKDYSNYCYVFYNNKHSQIDYKSIK